MADESESASYDDDKIVFAVRYEGKIFVTLGAYVYCPSSDDNNAEEKRAIEYLIEKLKTNDAVRLRHEAAPIGFACVRMHHLDD